MEGILSNIEWQKRIYKYIVEKIGTTEFFVNNIFTKDYYQKIESEKDLTSVLILFWIKGRKKICIKIFNKNKRLVSLPISSHCKLFYFSMDELSNLKSEEKEMNKENESRVKVIEKQLDSMKVKLIELDTNFENTLRYLKRQLVNIENLMKDALENKVD